MADGSLKAGEVLELYFLETRAKLLEIGATLDRVGRAGGAAGDGRMEFIAGALEILRDGEGKRAERIQRLYSKG